MAYHIHGPSESTLAIWSAKIQSFKFRALKFFGPSKSSPANSVTPAQQPKSRKKHTKTPDFGGSGLFKVVNVDKDKKLVTGACW